MYTWTDGTYLMHHGIKGQKWGVRRFQNEDGSLTPAGRARYNARESKAKYKQARKEYSKAYDKAYRSSKSLAVLTRAGRAQRDADIANTYDKAKAVQRAKEEYKSAKKEAKKLTRAENIAKGKEVVSKVSNKLNNVTKADMAKYANIGLGITNAIVGNTFNAYVGLKRAYDINKLQKEGILSGPILSENPKASPHSNEAWTEKPSKRPRGNI